MYYTSTHDRMPEVFENFLGGTLTYDEIDRLIERIGMFDTFYSCSSQSYNSKVNVIQGYYLGIPDEYGGYPIFRLPTVVRSRKIHKDLQGIIEQFREKFSEQFREKFPFNTVKINRYYKDIDGIAKHSDKTIDLEDGSDIYIYRLTKEKDQYRSLNFEYKKNNETKEYKLKNDTLIKISYDENKKTVHWVPRETETECISFIFRKCTTYKLDDGRIYGSGARFKTYEDRMKSELDCSSTDNTTDLIKLFTLEDKYESVDDELYEKIRYNTY